MHPIETLRRFLESDDILRPMSTQAEFARLLGRSEPLIRNLEKGRMKVSPKFAKRVSEITDVSEAWLLGKMQSKNFIPCRDGSRLTVRKLRESIMSHGFLPMFQADVPNVAIQSVIDRTLIESLTNIVKAVLTDHKMNLTPNAPDPFADLLQWVSRHAAAKHMNSV